MADPRDPDRPTTLTAYAARRAKLQVRQRERTATFRPRSTNSRRSALAYARACMTPSGGIPAPTGTGSVNPGSAVCEMYDFDGNATTPVWVDSGTTELVFNQGGAAVAGSKLVLVSYFQGYPFVVVEPC